VKERRTRKNNKNGCSAVLWANNNLSAKQRKEAGEKK
jgi:hypothetical protein